MWRTRAVRNLLVEGIAGLRAEADDLEPSLASLRRAERKSQVVIALDWIAILLLVLARSGEQAILTLGPTADAIFSLGVLAIATHSGFRLGQLETYRATRRALNRMSKHDAS